MIDKKLWEKFKLIEMLAWGVARKLPRKEQKKIAKEVGEWEARETIKRYGHNIK